MKLLLENKGIFNLALNYCFSGCSVMLCVVFFNLSSFDISLQTIARALSMT